MRIRLHDWIEERNERTTVSDQHPVLTCSQDGILLQSAYFKKQIASQDNTGYKIVHRGDFTYRAMSDTGRFYIHQMDCAEIGIVSPAYPVFYLKAGAPIVPEYLLLFFESELFHELVSSKSKGSTRLSLRLSKIGDITVEFPEVDEQNKRVALMNSLSQQIEDVSRREKSYGDTIKSLFNELIGTFRGEYEPASNIGVFKNGMNFSASDHGYEIPCVSVGSFKDHSSLSDASVIPLVSLSSAPDEDYCLRDGDLLFVRSNGNKALVGRCVMCKFGECEIVYSGFVIRFRRTHSGFRDTFLLHFFRSEETREQLQGRGANIQNLNQTMLGNIRVPMIGLNQQDAFICRVKEIDKLRFNAIKQKELFTEYRSSFLQDFFEGGNKHE